MKKTNAKKRRENSGRRSQEKTGSMPAQTPCGPAPDRTSGQDWLTAALVCAGFLILYTITACPTVFFGDSGEFSAVAACWGVAHAPGYPLYCLLLNSFARLLPLGEIAWRTNVFSALCGSLAVGMLFLVCRRIGASRPAAAAAAMCFGTGATLWSQAIVAEVYCLDMLLLLLALYAAFRLQEKAFRIQYFFCGLMTGLMLGHRSVNLFYFVPVIFAFMAAARKRSGQPLSIFWYALAGMAASGAVFLYLPIASSFDPAIDNGDPETLGRFWTVITAKSYQNIFGSSSFAKELRRLTDFLATIPVNLGVAAIAAPAGFWLLVRRGKRLLAAALAWATFSCVGFSIKYNIPDIDVYFLPALAMLSLAAAFGFDLLPRRLAWLAVLLGLVNLPLQYRSHDLSNVRLGEQWGKELLAAAPAGAILLTINDTTNNLPLYLQTAQGLRPDVCLNFAFAKPPVDWYVDVQRRRHPQVIFPDPNPEYYLQDERIRNGESWLKTFIQSNIQNRPVCLVGQPEILLRHLNLKEFLPCWHKVPDGILYCLDSPGKPFDLEQRIARTQAFWDRHPAPGPQVPDGADAEYATIAFSYLKARFFFAEALANLGRTDAALAQLRIVAAANPDALEEKIREDYHTPNMYRLGARATLALSSEHQDKQPRGTTPER